MRKLWYGIIAVGLFPLGHAPASSAPEVSSQAATKPAATQDLEPVRQGLLALDEALRNASLTYRHIERGGGPGDTFDVVERLEIDDPVWCIKTAVDQSALEKNKVIEARFFNGEHYVLIETTENKAGAGLAESSTLVAYPQYVVIGGPSALVEAMDEAVAVETTTDEAGNITATWSKGTTGPNRLEYSVRFRKAWDWLPEHMETRRTSDPSTVSPDAWVKTHYVTEVVEAQKVGDRYLPAKVLGKFEGTFADGTVQTVVDREVTLLDAKLNDAPTADEIAASLPDVQPGTLVWLNRDLTLQAYATKAFPARLLVEFARENNLHPVYMNPVDTAATAPPRPGPGSSSPWLAFFLILLLVGAAVVAAGVLRSRQGR